MKFFGCLLQNKKDNYKALALLIVLFIFYMVINFPFIMYMNNNRVELAEHNPFYGVPFMLNIFNFDPSMYYGWGNTSIIHPFMNYFSGPLSFLASHLFDNLFFLVLQSAINALSVVMVYYYLRKSGSNNTLALLFATFFGVSSYNIFTAMIPDSYPYVQFIIILSVLYLQYSRMHAKATILPNALLALLNFAATSTNIIPFTGALFFNMIDWRNTKTFKKFVSILMTFLFLVVVFTLMQFVLLGGHSWINSWAQSLHDGGYRYVADFSFSQHWKAVHMLVSSPILTPDITLIDSGIVAFATDLMRAYPFYVNIIGYTIIVLAGLGFIMGIKSRESWTLASFIIFAIYLHIIKGYGLEAFKYDMYLYAGHFLFAFFLLSARYLAQINHAFFKKALMGMILIFMLTTLGNNIIKHMEALNHIEKSYSVLKIAGAKT